MDPGDIHVMTCLPADASAAHTELAAALVELGQAHLFESWPPAGERDEEKRQMLAQLAKLEANYPGGLAAYIQSARNLLGQSVRGENPLQGWSPSVPEDGFDLTPGSDEFARYEERGLAEARHMAFAVPAGGLGERLGFSGVKFALPAEISTGATVLQVYVAYILAVQAHAEAQGGGRCRLPLAIMVSDDTAEGIQRLLDANDHFGLEPAQVTLLKQEKVAALADSDARLALKNPFEVATKPHGHGDIHFLLHSSGTAQRWAAEGRKWLYFFQDTNTLYFAHFLATVGVTAASGAAVNMVSVPRKAKESIGAVCQLTHSDGRKMVCNVEYNQLEPLLLSSGHTEGDANGPDGFSPYPGSINGLMYDLPKYVATLASTGGQIDEFINPKYTDASRAKFKSPTRLECMMQDYVKTVPAAHKVAWTRYPIEFGYFPCKNDIVSGAALSVQGIPPGCASSSEMAVYNVHVAQLRLLGAKVEPAVATSYRGVQLERGAAVVLDPSFAPCLSLLRPKLPTAEQVHISARSTLLLKGEALVIERLELDGALEIIVEDGGSLVVKELRVANKGWELVELNDAEQAAAEETLAIRGYRLLKHETRSIHVKAGEHLIYENDEVRPVEEEPGRSKPSLEVTTGATAANGLTVSTGHQIAQSSDVKEVKPGCCTLS